MIPGPEHRDRARGQGRQPIAKRLRRPLTGQAQQQGDLHVRRLATCRQIHRRGVLVPVHEHQARPASDVTQRGNGSEQHRAISAVHEREPASRQRGAHPAVQRVDHLQQRPLVEQSPRESVLNGAQLLTVPANNATFNEAMSAQQLAFGGCAPSSTTGTSWSRAPRASAPSSPPTAVSWLAPAFFEPAYLDTRSG